MSKRLSLICSIKSFGLTIGSSSCLDNIFANDFADELDEPDELECFCFICSRNSSALSLTSGSSFLDNILAKPAELLELLGWSENPT